MLFLRVGSMARADHDALGSFFIRLVCDILPLVIYDSGPSVGLNYRINPQLAD